MQPTVAILCGGGPAPGIIAVISTVAKVFLFSIESEFAQLCFENLHYINECDFERASDFIQSPQDYNFNQILNWN